MNILEFKYYEPSFNILDRVKYLGSWWVLNSEVNKSYAWRNEELGLSARVE